ncbi:hypothetical protein ACUXZZ_01580 [Streptomyces graminifolii]|uniref:hypothetical protein n=1 Tax=Streptomyces graminifolii TaxID=1266771 RepID=UPI004058F3B6
MVWSEWEMTGTAVDGTPFLVRGVVVARTAGDLAAQTDSYLEPVAWGRSPVIAASVSARFR